MPMQAWTTTALRGANDGGLVMPCWSRLEYLALEDTDPKGGLGQGH
eukprot:CAMPEP_0115458604 /NCGR_PEP_ID=MMETSP0271-20121206/45820_1 /TAXON_ID=71861 /ORGANISM="Scrippsiella trochoidea, Strain CCMP3099" /LENGTH=45 /DNA_ID= /DNA_START= /DNA_END= /DNA_ORIENTATION=